MALIFGEALMIWSTTIVPLGLFVSCYLFPARKIFIKYNTEMLTKYTEEPIIYFNILMGQRGQLNMHRHCVVQVLQLIEERGNICKQIHLPAQSGSSQVLKAMRRGWDIATLTHLTRRGLILTLSLDPSWHWFPFLNAQLYQRGLPGPGGKHQENSPR